MRLSNLRRCTTLLAGIGLLGFAGISFGDDGSPAPTPPQPTTAAPESPAAPAPSIADPLAAQVDEAIRVNSQSLPRHRRPNAVANHARHVGLSPRLRAEGTRPEGERARMDRLRRDFSGTAVV